MFVAEDMYQLGNGIEFVCQVTDGLIDAVRCRYGRVSKGKIIDIFLTRIYFCTGRYRDETGNRRLPEQDV